MSVFAGRGAGAFGALGGELGFGGILSFDWYPEPEVVAARVMQLAGYLENFIPPLEASKGIARADMQMHFDTESSPDGAAWAPLNEEYVANKRGGAAHPILQLSGEMHDAAVSESAYFIDAHDLFIDTSGFPFYWVFHEGGRAGISGFREFVEAARAAGLEIEEGATGGGMPARPFVGVSFEAQLQIVEVFDAWFSGAVAGFYTQPSGTVQRRLLSGRFGSAIR